MSTLTAEPVLAPTDLAALHALASQVEDAIRGAAEFAVTGRLRADCIHAIAGYPASRRDGASVAAASRLVELALAAGWNDQPASAELVADADRIAGEGWTGLLAALLLAPAWQIKSLPSFEGTPLFLWRILALATFRVPPVLTELGQTDAIARTQLSCLRALARLVRINPGASAVREAGLAALASDSRSALIHAVAAQSEMALCRGQIRAALNRRPDSLPLLPMPRDGRKLRVGVVLGERGSARSLRAALPWIEQLDPARFTTEIFVAGEVDGVVEIYLSGRAILVRRLIGSATEQAFQLAAEGLDIAFAVTGEAVATASLETLFSSRMAPLQVAVNEFEVGSGLPGMDFLLTRNATAGKAGQSSERLLIVPWSGIRLLPAGLRGEARQTWARADLGFPEDAVIFAAAAPFALLSPEWAELAARVLSELPTGRLLIHSGAPADEGPAGMARLCAVLEPALVRHQIEPSRLMLSNEPLGSMAEVGTLLGLADFYLDTFPASDSEGCQLALAVGVPLLTVEPAAGQYHFAANALRVLGSTVGLAAGVDELAARAVQLGRDAAQRTHLREALSTGLTATTAFHDPLALGEATGAMLESAFDLAALDPGRSITALPAPLVYAPPALVAGALEEAAILLEAGLPTEALPRLAPFFSAAPADTRTRALFYSTLIQSGHAARAVAGLETAMERGFAVADTARLLARAHLWLGYRDLAMTALRASLRLDPKHPETWAVLTEIAQGGGHHAIAEELAQLRAALANSNAAANPAGSGKSLYFSPVGKAGKAFLTQMASLFPADQFDFLVVCYDDTDFSDLGGRVEVIRDRGHKWRFVKKYLTPEKVAAYDYVFIWDDDLDPTDFDPTAFVDILRRNRIDIAQPSLTADSFSFHPITVTHPGPVGRLTNFVEIMCPVYSSKIWPSIYPYIEPEVNELGWGYDLIPLGRKAIVDCMSVRHTRPGQSAMAGAAQQSAMWCARHQISRPALVNLWSLS